MTRRFWLSDAASIGLIAHLIYALINAGAFLMSTQACFQLIALLVVLLALAWPTGIWFGAVAQGRLPRWLAPLRRAETGQA